MKPKILVPFDFSDSATSALAWAADLQVTTNSDLPIHLVHVISTFPMGGPPVTALEMLLPGVEELAPLRVQLLEAAAKVGARAVVDVLTRPIGIGEAVVAAAQEIHADLIVMGTHGRSGLGRLVLGSVAEHVTRHAPCPVVTVRTRHG